MISIVVFVTAKPGMRAKVMDRFLANTSLVLAEQGCREYSAYVNLDSGLPVQAKLDDDTFVVLEKWDSMEALTRHIASPHMAAYSADTRDWIASRTIHIVRPAS